MPRSLIALAFLFVPLLVSSMPIIAADDLTCLPEGERASSSFYAHLQHESYAALERRTKNFEQLKTPEQIGEYQRKLRELFVRQLGGFPERTPLNAQVVRKLDAEGYRIENVIFESRPRTSHHGQSLYSRRSRSLSGAWWFRVVIAAREDCRLQPTFRHRDGRQRHGGAEHRSHRTRRAFANPQ